MAAFEAARQADFGRIIRCRFWVFFPVDRSPQPAANARRLQNSARRSGFLTKTPNRHQDNVK